MQAKPGREVLDKPIQCSVLELDQDEPWVRLLVVNQGVSVGLDGGYVDIESVVAPPPGWHEDDGVF